MTVPTRNQTPGFSYHINFSNTGIMITVSYPEGETVNLHPDDLAVLDANLRNSLEMLLSGVSKDLEAQRIARPPRRGTSAFAPGMAPRTPPSPYITSDQIETIRNHRRKKAQHEKPTRDFRKIPSTHPIKS